MSNHIVRAGESITDVVLNTTGNLSNWDAVLEANGHDTWTPDLLPGQSVIIPAVNTDENTLRQLKLYPACNASVSDVFSQITGVFDVMLNNWILATTFWQDDAIWIDTKFWND